MDYSITIWILIIPFLSFVLTGLAGSRMKPLVSGIIGTGSMFVAFVLSILTANSYFFHSAKVENAFASITAFNMVWLRFNETLHIDIGVLLDPISVMMLVVITTVSLMVHLYSIGYMKGDPGFARFYAFLSLFSFSMLGLVVATNIFQMYMFWELVGVSSYLLIGYYYDKPSAVAASKKAFIVTRFADLGFLLGILLLSYMTGTFDFLTITDPKGMLISQGPGAMFMGCSLTTWAVVLIFMGGAGKSAMFPLHIWLPDAMEGPTPVSALIHAATMVVAGVYLVARLFSVFALSAPGALDVVAWVGAISSLFAAVIACTQTDIKRVLAYSTMSQIGYMMLALGVSGYGAEHGLGYMASMFHLFTHAMFKALLFLGAGAVIHAVHSNEMGDMGGLRKYLPITHLTFLVACLAIAGIPPFAGFFSKDEILVAAFEHSKVLFAIEYLVAGLTAFYMFRLYYNIFWSEEPHYHHAPHEAPAIMTGPLLFLAAASACVGFLPFSELVTSDRMAFEAHMHWNIAIASVAVAVIGIAIATVLYRKKSGTPDSIANSLQGIYTAAYRKFYIDEIYVFVTKQIIFRRVAEPIAWFDRNVIDGSMNGIAFTTNLLAERIKWFQSGQMQWYAFVFVCAAIGFVLLFLSVHY